MKPALLIIDLQRAYYRGTTAGFMDGAIEYINATLPLFKERSWPIIWIQDVDEEDGVVPGSDGFEFVDTLNLDKDSVRVHKHYSNSFNKTNLDELLRRQGVDTVILTGYCAENCVLATYRGAQDRDYLPIILKNGIASYREEHKEMVEKITEIISYNALKRFLESLR